MSHWLSGLDSLFVLRCCKETYLMLFNLCLALLEGSKIFIRKKCLVALGRQVDHLTSESSTK